MLEETSSHRSLFTSEEEGAGAIPVDGHGVSLGGRGRRVNEDAYLLAPLSIGTASGPAYLFAVADGIGGGPAGERASAMAIQGLYQFVRASVGDGDPADLLRQGVLRCHREILADIEAHPELFGMGTTLTAALVLWPRAWVVNAGDSRCYLLRESRLRRLTQDQTLVEKLTQEGILTPETARRSRWRHALLNHLGKSSAPPDPQIESVDLHPGDALLLATDGVTDPLEDSVLEVLASGDGDAEHVAGAVVRAAEQSGGRDDKTVVLARF